ncbi:DUF4174 domain-containing protein [Roseovarius salis]|uniref:DUF4174 domain-containing protein n=1 Tax=Roseovarius salis TaxID=3376063 RepID=UPI0037C8414D
MRQSLTLVFLMFSLALGAGGTVAAEDEGNGPDIVMSGENVDLTEFKWIKRPLVVFADSPADPRFVQQMEYINDRLEDLAERDVVVLTDTAADTGSALRDKLHPRGFMLTLIGKDGDVYLRKPLPWSVREITRVIDKMPMRQQEIRDRRGDS